MIYYRTPNMSLDCSEICHLALQNPTDVGKDRLSAYLNIQYSSVCFLSSDEFAKLCLEPFSNKPNALLLSLNNHFVRDYVRYDDVLCALVSSDLDVGVLTKDIPQVVDSRYKPLISYTNRLFLIKDLKDFKYKDMRVSKKYNELSSMFDNCTVIPYGITTVPGWEENNNDVRFAFIIAIPFSVLYNKLFCSPMSVIRDWKVYVSAADIKEFRGYLMKKLKSAVVFDADYSGKLLVKPLKDFKAKHLHPDEFPSIEIEFLKPMDRSNFNLLCNGLYINEVYYASNGIDVVGARVKLVLNDVKKYKEGYPNYEL